MINVKKRKSNYNENLKRRRTETEESSSESNSNEVLYKTRGVKTNEEYLEELRNKDHKFSFYNVKDDKYNDSIESLKSLNNEERYDYSKIFSKEQKRCDFGAKKKSVLSTYLDTFNKAYVYRKVENAKDLIKNFIPNSTVYHDRSNYFYEEPKKGVDAVKNFLAIRKALHHPAPFRFQNELFYNNLRANMYSLLGENFESSKADLKKEFGFTDFNPYTLVAASRRSGKSYELAVDAATFMIGTPGFEIVNFSTGKEQAKEFLRLVKKLAKGYPGIKNRVLVDNESEFSILFENGKISRVRAFASNGNAAKVN